MKEPPLAAPKRQRQLLSTASSGSAFSKHAANAFPLTLLKMTAEEYLNYAVGTKVPFQW